MPNTSFGALLNRKTQADDERGWSDGRSCFWAAAWIAIDFGYWLRMLLVFPTDLRKRHAFIIRDTSYAISLDGTLIRGEEDLCSSR